MVTDMDWLHEQRAEQGRLTVPLRLLFVTTSAGAGGIEHCSARLAAHLQARRHQVAHVCRPGGTVESLCHGLGVPTHGLLVRNSGDLAAAWCLSRVIVAQSAHIIHVHSRRDFVPAVAAVALARRSGASPRLVLHAHLAKPLGALSRLSGRLFERGADAVIAVSDAVRRLLLATHGLDPAFVSRIYNGVDAGVCVSAGSRARARGQWGLPEEALIVGMVGRLNAKGQDALLSAAPALLARLPSLHFVLLGPDGRAGDHDRLAARARAGGFGDRVVLPGPCEDVAGAMCGFDALAHLPDEEAFGMVLAEAMAMGLPTVATRVGGCPEIVKDGVTGYLVWPGDAVGLVEAVSDLLAAGSAARRAQMGAAGRERVRELFRLQTQMVALEELYGRITGRSS